MIVNLDDVWFLDCDATSVALTEKRVITGENSRGLKPKAENIGKTRDVQHGFYGSIANAAQAYLNKSVASMPGMLTATQLIATWNDMTARVEAACKNIPKRGVEKMEKTTGVEQTPKTSPAGPAFTIPQTFVLPQASL